MITEHDDNADNISESSPKTPALQESEEEDREIIESLTKAHSVHSERHVDVDEIPSSVVKRESAKNDCMPKASAEFAMAVNTETLPEKRVTDFEADDAMADMEVSRLTSLIESKKSSVPKKLKRPTASFVSIPKPPGVLPEVSDVVDSPVKKESSPDDLDELLRQGNFQPLKEMSFSVSPRYRLCRRTNGSNGVKSNGENGRDSQSSNSSDDHAPLIWKLQKDGPPEKLNGGSRGSKEEDIDQILNTFHVVENDQLDDNHGPSTSKSATKPPANQNNKM